MNDLVFSCPQCDQHIACDESYYGLQINCPTCKMPIQLPVDEAPAGGGSAGSPPSNVTVPSGLSIARPKPRPTEFRGPPPMDLPQTRVSRTSTPDNNVWLTTWLLSFFLGGLGVDRFYNGRTGLGVGKLLANVLSCGSIGLIWAMIDFILLLAGKYQDARGNYLKRPQGRYMTLQVIGVVLAALSGVACLFYAFVISAWVIALSSHSSFSSSQFGQPPTPFASSVGASAANRFTPPTEVNGTALQQWTLLSGRTVRVSSNPRIPCRTGITLTGNNRYRLYPCPTDAWNTSPGRWSSVDYQGHISESERTKNGRPYLQLCYRVGNSATKAVQSGEEITGNGKLYLFPSDALDRTADNVNNQGAIRVKIAKVN